MNFLNVYKIYMDVPLFIPNIGYLCLLSFFHGQSHLAFVDFNSFYKQPTIGFGCWFFVFYFLKFLLNSLGSHWFIGIY